MNSTAVGLLAVSIIFPLLSLIAVLLRLLARRMRSANLGADDCVVLVAQLFCIGLGINTTIGVAHGVIGKPQKELGLSKAVLLLKVIYADTFLCFSALAIIKIGVLLFYKRVFPIKKFFIAANIMIGVIVAWHIGSILGLLLSDSPISSHWNPKAPISDRKIDFPGFLLTHASLDLVFDIVVLCLPLPVISTLHMKTRRKLELVGIFWLGGFCAVAEAVRIYYFHKFLYEDLEGHEDAFGPVVANVLVWSRVEPCCSVIAACLPTLRPLLSKSSMESVAASVRSVISLGSIHSRGSRGSGQNKDAPDGSDIEDSRRDWAKLNGSREHNVEGHAVYDIELGGK